MTAGTRDGNIKGPKLIVSYLRSNARRFCAAAKLDAILETEEGEEDDVEEGEDDDDEEGEGEEWRRVRSHDLVAPDSQETQSNPGGVPIRLASANLHAAFSAGDPVRDSSPPSAAARTARRSTGIRTYIMAYLSTAALDTEGRLQFAIASVLDPAMVFCHLCGCGMGSEGGCVLGSHLKPLTPEANFAHRSYHEVLKQCTTVSLYTRQVDLLQELPNGWGRGVF